MRSWHVGATAFVVAGLVGCSPYKFEHPHTPPVHPRADPPEGLAQLCVIRPHVVNSSHIFTYEDNEHLVGGTRGNGYFCYFADPGEHQVVAKHVKKHWHNHDPERVSITLTAGETAYLWHEIDFASHDISEIDADEADDLLRDARYQVLEAAPHVARLPTAYQVAPASAKADMRTMECKVAEDHSKVCVDPGL